MNNDLLNSTPVRISRSVSRVGFLKTIFATSTATFLAGAAGIVSLIVGAPLLGAALLVVAVALFIALVGVLVAWDTATGDLVDYGNTHTDYHQIITNPSAGFRAGNPYLKSRDIETGEEVVLEFTGSSINRILVTT